MSEKTKTIAELADYVRSDLPVQEIIDNFQFKNLIIQIE